MSGQYRLVGTLTEAQADLFYEFGFSLNILLDVSHAIHVRTIRADRPKEELGPLSTILVMLHRSEI